MIRSMHLLSLVLITAALVACDAENAAPEPLEPATQSAAADAPGAQLKEGKLGETENVHVFDKCYLAGQPSVEDMKLAKEQGVKTIINLIPADEQPFDEAAAAKEIGLHYISLPIADPEDLTDELITRARTELKQAPQPLIMHCGSANRVGALWLAKRVLDDGLSTEAALAEADQVGLRNEEMKTRVLEYIEEHRAK